MKIPPNYSITSEITGLITKIEAYRIHLSSLEIPKQVKEKIQRVSLLKSSLFSAKIEGNTLELSDIEMEGKNGKQNKIEVLNIVRATSFIDSKVKKGNITKKMILSLHKAVLKNISPYAGNIRHEVSAIFNTAGVAIYMPPPPQNIEKLLNDLSSYINRNKDISPFVTAFIAHLVFEKIHPFLDGNGRVGRLLIVAILKIKGLSFNFAIPFEEYLNDHKDEYYFHLDDGLRHTNDYLLFMLDAFFQQIKKIKEQVNNELSKKVQIFLPPRQEEIYCIIKDHKVVSFDMIRRRFLKVPERTLRYDLKKLSEKNVIEKTGETRGRYYRIKK